MMSVLMSGNAGVYSSHMVPVVPWQKGAYTSYFTLLLLIVH